jgi:hypothetical protein
MKTRICILLSVLMASMSAGAQSTLTYDQESAAGSNYVPPSTYYDPVLTPNTNFNDTAGQSQSFTPYLPSVGFVRLAFDSIDNPGTPGRTIYVNLWSDSVGGMLLGTSQLIVPQNWAQGPAFTVTNFFFASPIAVSPGTTYYLQVGLQPTTAIYEMYLAGGDYNYPGGDLIVGSTPQSGYDLWFQEGTYAVPEPSSWRLIFLSGCVLFSFWLCRKRGSTGIQVRRDQVRDDDGCIFGHTKLHQASGLKRFNSNCSRIMEERTGGAARFWTAAARCRFSRRGAIPKAAEYRRSPRRFAPFDHRGIFQWPQNF